MRSLSGFAVALGLAYGAGLNLYATLAFVGLAAHFGIIGPVPSSLEWITSGWVIGVASVLFVAELIAALTPGVSSAWETFHSVVRPPAAAVLAASVVWRDDPAVVLAAALVGGLLAVVIHTAKLGLQYAIDSASATRAGLIALAAEVALVAVVTLLVWRYPFVTLAAALGVLVGFILLARVILGTLRQVFAGHWMPGCGLLQEPRTLVTSAEEEDEV